MFVDTRDLPDGCTVQADLCVVGAGAAGIALALEFVGTPVRVVVLESGGPVAEHNGRGIYRVVAGSTPELSVDPSLTCYLGGNTNHWAAHCRPLDEADFEPRGWVQHSGWPIRRQELLPYYERAQGICGLSDFRWYDLDACRAHLQHQPLDVDPATLTNKVVHACPVRSFAALHSQRLEAAENVRIVLHARALRLKTNAGADHVHAVETIGAGGRRSHVEAGVFVLAAGGVENARLLLCSNDVSRNGLANDHDLVGRFFMEHWYVDIPLGRWGGVHDLVFYDTPQPVGAAYVWGHLALSEELLRRERMAGLSLWVRPIPPAAPSVGAVGRVMAFLRRQARLKQPLTDIQLALSNPGNVTGRARTELSRRSEPRLPRPGYLLRVQIEQTPDPENRIRLTSQSDRYGSPDVDLVLRLAEEERRGHVRALRIVGAALGLHGPRLARQLQLRLGARRFGFFAHHMGTTRMHSDPARGVVDADCRVHGVSNLFVAGSSVFPTAGTAAPTLTIVALALRLAEHLRNRRGMLTFR
jgi:choline dehydrogenase-like flavoprotein